MSVPAAKLSMKKSFYLIKKNKLPAFGMWRLCHSMTVDADRKLTIY